MKLHSGGLPWGQRSNITAGARNTGRAVTGWRRAGRQRNSRWLLEVEERAWEEEKYGSDIPPAATATAPPSASASASASANTTSSASASASANTTSSASANKGLTSKCGATACGVAMASSAMQPTAKLR